MTEQIATKLEIDVTQVGELLPAVDLAVKRCIPALVVHPTLIGLATMYRITRRGRFKIITPVDWPKGDREGMTKLRGMTGPELFDTDGFEILLTPGLSKPNRIREVFQLDDFVRNQVNRNAEIRFVIGSQTVDDNECEAMIDALKSIRTPALVRNDHRTKALAGKAGIEVHSKFAEMVRTKTGFPVKVCGNVNNVKAATARSYAHRIGVSLNQAQSILRDTSKLPEAIKQMLMDGEQ